MADVSGGFIEQVSDEVKQAYQEVKPEVVMATRVRPNVIGSTARFNKLGAFTANTRSGRNADLTAITPDHTKVTATLADYFVPVYIDDLDKIKTNIDVRKEYITGIAGAMARKHNEVVIASLDAATMETGHTIAATGGLTKANILGASKLMNIQSVPKENRFMLISPEQLEEGLSTAELSSTDYGIANAMQGLLTGTINKAFGFTWIISNQLTANVGIRDCYAFDRNAIGTAMGQDVKIRVDYSVDKASDLVLGSTSIGVAVIDTWGIVKIQATE